MLTARENLLETIHGGKPDRMVNQYEAFHILSSPWSRHSGGFLKKGDMNIKNAWGIINSWPESAPASFPEHSPDKVVVKDIEEWKEYVKAPSLKFTDYEWDEFAEIYASVDNTQAFRTFCVAPGLFEQTHHLCSMTEALVNYITYPDEMHDLVCYLRDWELELAEGVCAHLHPDALHHHDDWGSEKSTFLRPEMFADYFLDAYKEIYGYYHEHGVQVISHHSDSFCETLVPYMIEMGIDIWQGVMQSNNIPEMIKKYGGKISFMGGIDNKRIDFPGWTREDCRKAIEYAYDNYYTGNYYIPCITQGMPGSMFPGAYETLAEEIDKFNEEKFGVSDPSSMRHKLQLWG